MTDADLMTAFASNNDHAAFSVLYGRYASPMLVRLRRYFGDDPIADDVLQDTWLSIKQNGAQYDEARPFANWAYSIMCHAAVNTLRKLGAKYRKSVSLQSAPPLKVAGDEYQDFEPPDDSPDVLTLLAVHDEMEKLKSIIEKLSPKDQQLVTMFYMEGKAYPEIAKALRITVKNCRTRLHRIRKFIAEQFAA